MTLSVNSSDFLETKNVPIVVPRYVFSKHDSDHAIIVDVMNMGHELAFFILLKELTLFFILCLLYLQLPLYANLTFGTFVCSSCSGIL